MIKKSLRTIHTENGENKDYDKQETEVILSQRNKLKLVSSYERLRKIITSI